MSELTLEDLIEAYFTKYANKNTKTAVAINASLRKHVRFIFKKKLSDITIDVAVSLHQRIGKRSPIQANRINQCLKAAWNKGIKWQIAPPLNPFALVEHNPEHVRSRRFGPSEVRRLEHALRQHGHKDLHDFVMLALNTGVRRTSLLSMRWDDLNLEDGLWIIPDSKSGTPQLILVGPLELDS